MSTDRRSEAPSPDRGSVTVVIPVRNEERFLEACLESVRAQDYSESAMEILVADGRSTDRTREIVARISGVDPRVRLIDNPGGIVPTGMNAAIRAAAGEYIVRVDGHACIPRDYVRRVMESFRSTGADCVGGRMEARGDGYWGGVISLVTSHPFGVGGSRFHYSGTASEADTVYLGAYPRSVLERIGMYDERFVRNQDDELNYRLRSVGGRVWYDPAIHASYVNRSTLGRLFSQYRQYGFWKVRLYRKHPRLFNLRHAMPAAFVGAWLASGLTLFVDPAVGAGLVFGLPLLHGVVGAVSGLRAGWTIRDVRGAVPAFLVLHVSYGLGFWQGLLDAMFRPRAFTP